MCVCVSPCIGYNQVHGAQTHVEDYFFARTGRCFLISPGIFCKVLDDEITARSNDSSGDISVHC